MPSSPASDEPRQEHEDRHEHEQAPGPAVAERDLNAELAQMEDRFKRALADLDNFRKRSARELERAVGERVDSALAEWLEVVDGVERALRQNPPPPLYDGLRAVLEHMDAVLDRQGVRRIGETGEPFDPARHQAVDIRETDEVPDRTVVEVVRSGYARGDHVLRPAEVIVARGPQPPR